MELLFFFSARYGPRLMPHIFLTFAAFDFALYLICGMRNVCLDVVATVAVYVCLDVVAAAAVYVCLDIVVAV